jgi:hypothetical protein
VNKEFEEISNLIMEYPIKQKYTVPDPDNLGELASTSLTTR